MTRIAVKTEANNNAHMAKDGSLSFNTKTRKDVRDIERTSKGIEKSFRKNNKQRV